MSREPDPRIASDWCNVCGSSERSHGPGQSRNHAFVSGAPTAPSTQDNEPGLREALGRLVAAVIAMKQAIPPGRSLGPEWATFLSRTGDVNMGLDRAEAALSSRATPEPASDGGLDAAWREAEAALPEEWSLSMFRRPDDGWWCAQADSWDSLTGRIFQQAYEPTPAAALQALAVRRREQSAGGVE